VADSLDLPLSELRELNPALLKLVAPSGYSLHVPKGTVGSVEAAFSIVPADRRDSWRVHRVETGDTFAAIAKRYGTSPTTLSSANHDELPDAGAWIAIPAAYPGDRPVKTASRTTAKVASKQAYAQHRAPAAASLHVSSGQASASSHASAGVHTATNAPKRTASNAHKATPPAPARRASNSSVPAS
jgi:membrane-bound lytic murein transglycosylase D